MMGISMDVVQGVFLIILFLSIISVPLISFLNLKKEIGLIRFSIFSILLLLITSIFSYGTSIIDNYYCRDANYYERCVFGVLTWDIFMPVITGIIIFYSTYIILHFLLFIYLKSKK